MGYEQIIYETGAVARIILNRPDVNNAQSRRLLEEMDHAFEAANADRGVQVVVLSGTGRHFSAGHDLGSEAELIDRGERGYETARPGSYDRLRDLNVTNTLRWRNFPKPTIAMVQGYCIYGGWMIASAMDVIFASEEARFLPAHNQYFGVPWDLGARKTKELLFQNRFLTAQEAEAVGFVNRVYRPEDLERETLAYAAEVATTNPMHNRQVKFSVNNMLDAQGFTTHVTAAFQTYAMNAAGMGPATGSLPAEGVSRRLEGVDGALTKLNEGQTAFSDYLSASDD
jgi:enoyl-CoA hydratase